MTTALKEELVRRALPHTKLVFFDSTPIPSDYGLPNFTVDVHEVLQGNVLNDTVPCMTLAFSRSSPRSKFEVIIRTLRYTKAQSKCTIPGEVLVRWVLGLRPKWIQSVRLSDASQKTVANVRVRLTPFRKFLTGVGWYEQYGLLPDTTMDNYMFQESYRRLRRTPVDALRLLVLHTLRPRIPPPENQETKFLRRDDHPSLEAYESDAWYQILWTIVRQFDFVPPGTMGLDAALVSENLITDMQVHTVRGCERFVRLFGAPIVEHGNDLLKLTPHETRFLHRMIAPELRTSTCKCTLTALAPPGMRKVLTKVVHDADASDDAHKYVDMLNDVLVLLHHLTLLHTPSSLVTPTTYKTPKSPNKVCSLKCAKRSKQKSRKKDFR